MRRGEGRGRRGDDQGMEGAGYTIAKARILPSLNQAQHIVFCATVKQLSLS